MTKELRSELGKMTDIDFHELEQAIGIARFVRQMQKKHEPEIEWIVKKLEIEDAQFGSIVNASYPFDLRMISKIQAANEEIASIRAKQNADQLLKFPPYKYNTGEKDSPF